MQVHSRGAAQPLSRNEIALTRGAEDYAVPPADTLNSETDLRSNVERQFTLMDHIHNRIREEFLKTEHLMGH